MPSLRTLLKKLDVLHRQRADVEHEIDATEREIIAAAPKSRRKRSNVEAVEIIKALVHVLRDAGEPLPRREIGARLGIEAPALHYRLTKAIAMKFVERVSGGRYQTTSAVPAL